MLLAPLCCHCWLQLLGYFFPSFDTSKALVGIPQNHCSPQLSKLGNASVHRRVFLCVSMAQQLLWQAIGLLRKIDNVRHICCSILTCVEALLEIQAKLIQSGCIIRHGCQSAAEQSHTGSDSLLCHRSHTQLLQPLHKHMLFCKPRLVSIHDLPFSCSQEHMDVPYGLWLKACVSASLVFLVPQDFINHCTELASQRLLKVALTQSCVKFQCIGCCHMLQ